jgi:hypothetical protein
MKQWASSTGGRTSESMPMRASVSTRNPLNGQRFSSMRGSNQ